MGVPCQFVQADITDDSQVAAAVAAGGGSIADVNSIGSRIATTGTSLYGASTRAVTALTEYAAFAHGATGIRVNQTSPGGVESCVLMGRAATRALVPVSPG